MRLFYRSTTYLAVGLLLTPLLAEAGARNCAAKAIDYLLKKGADSYVDEILDQGLTRIILRTPREGDRSFGTGYLIRQVGYSVIHPGDTIFKVGEFTTFRGITKAAGATKEFTLPVRQAVAIPLSTKIWAAIYQSLAGRWYEDSIATAFDNEVKNNPEYYDELIENDFRFLDISQDLQKGQRGEEPYTREDARKDAEGLSIVYGTYYDHQEKVRAMEFDDPVFVEGFRQTPLFSDLIPLFESKKISREQKKKILNSRHEELWRYNIIPFIVAGGPEYEDLIKDPAQKIEIDRARESYWEFILSRTDIDFKKEDAIFLLMEDARRRSQSENLEHLGRKSDIEKRRQERINSIYGQ